MSGEDVSPAPGLAPSSAPARDVPRLLSLDLLRGLVVLLMLFVNQVDSVEGVPAFFRHAGENADTITLADLVLPAFLFMVGMSIPFALGGRLRREGTAATVRHLLSRAIALLVMGVLMVNADLGLPGGPLPPAWWGVVAVIGALVVWQSPPARRARRGLWIAARAAGVVLLLWLVLVYRGEAGGLVQIRPHWWGILGVVGWSYLTAGTAYLAVRNRPLALLALAAAANGLYYVDVLLQPAWMLALDPWLGLGGLVGSQGGIALAGAALGVLVASRLREGAAPWRLVPPAVVLALALVGAGALLHLGHSSHPSFAYDKASATPPWGLVSAGVTALAWVAFFAAADAAGWRRWPPLLQLAGQNELLTYLLEPIVLTLLAGSAAVFGRNPWAYLVERGTAAGVLAAVLFACLLGHLAGLLARAGVRPRL